MAKQGNLMGGKVETRYDKGSNWFHEELMQFCNNALIRLETLTFSHPPSTLVHAGLLI